MNDKIATYLSVDSCGMRNILPTGLDYNREQQLYTSLPDYVFYKGLLHILGNSYQPACGAKEKNYTGLAKLHFPSELQIAFMRFQVGEPERVEHVLLLVAVDYSL